MIRISTYEWIFFWGAVNTLRHTAITHLVQAGIDLPTVKRISGHKTLRMVERYSHQNGEHIQAAM
ncbi:MAG: tyrosine-type recombinase/integrase, partial [Vampirovibrionales bacterium]